MHLVAGVFGGLLGFLAEVVVQLACELFVRFSASSLRAAFRGARSPHPAIAGFGYAALGGVAGLLSLWLWRESFAHGPTQRLLTLLVAPIVAGLAMSALGAWRRRHDRPLVRLDHFGYAFLFAFALALVRFVGAR